MSPNSKPSRASAPADKQTSGSNNPGLRGGPLGSLLALIPLVVLALFLTSLGTFQSAGRLIATWSSAVIPWGLVVLAFAVAPATRVRELCLDPLSLATGQTSSARWIGLLPWMASLVVLLSMSLSPVPRAGLFAVALLPAYLLLPAALRELWRPIEQAKLALLLTALATFLAVLALWQSFGIWQSWAEGSRVSLPLGHHNLQAAITVALWPLALAVGGKRRWLVLALSLLPQLMVLIGTRSLGGATAVGVQVLVLIGWVAWTGRADSKSWRRWWTVPVGLALLLPGLLLVPRLVSIAIGEDSSALARMGYWRAAWTGFLQQPWVGWGPGSSHWLLAEHMLPVPGVHPPGEIVADPHSLPLMLLFETGVSGFLLAVTVAGLVLVNRRPASRRSDEAAVGEGRISLEAAAWLGAIGIAISSLFLAALSVVALPFLGVSLVALMRQPGSQRAAFPGAAPLSLAARIALHAAAPAAFLLALGVLMRPMLAAGLYEEARWHWWAEELGSTLEKVEQARSLDPSFPLYSFRQALLSRELGDTTAAARLAFEAARSARGVAPLWLLAATTSFAEPGASSPETGGAELSESLERACALAPFESVAPLLAARLPTGVDETQRAQLLARAVLAEPGFLAASAAATGDRMAGEGVTHVPLGIEHGAVLRERLESWPGIPDGLRTAHLDYLEALARSEEAGPGTSQGRSLVRLAFSVDQDAATSLSLHSFRRQPWPGVVARVEVDELMFDAIEAALPRATLLRETGREAFRAEGCRVRQ